jgi:transposase
MGKTERQIIQEEKKQFWQDHIQAWRRSGLNQSEYCRRQGLNKDAYFYWKKKLSQDSSPLSLVPVPVKINLAPTRKPLVVVIDNRYRIEVSEDFEAATLRKVVDTLEGR